MPPVRTDPHTSSTARRKRLAAKIDLLGFPAMAPCPQCVTSGAKCVIQKSSGRCSSCTKKNITCDGNFSDAEFDSLEAQKQKLFDRKMEARSRLTALAWELLATQKEHDKLDRQLERVHRRQEDMVELEARALEALDEITPPRLDLVVPEPPRPQAVSGDPVALMSDADFSWGDPEMLALMQDPGGSPEPGQA